MLGLDVEREQPTATAAMERFCGEIALPTTPPDVFAAALLNSQPMGFYGPATLVQDARRHGLQVRPVCVARSGWDCTVEADDAIRLGLRNPDVYKPLWVMDFPLFEYSAADKKLVSTHHLFTAPQSQDMAMLDADPTKVKGQQYDFVLNGFEIAGGSIRMPASIVICKKFARRPIALPPRAGRWARPIASKPVGPSSRRPCSSNSMTVWCSFTSTSVPDP